MYLDEAKNRAENLYRLDYGKLVPCTDEEVEELERWVQQCLPGAYREFLLWMGQSAGGFLQGSDCFYRHLKNIQLWAKELLQEDHFPDSLPDDAFIFFMHQGYQFNFFRLSDGDDPPVYFYLEEMPVRTSFTQMYQKFSDFLLTEIDGHITVAHKRIQGEKESQ